MKSVMFNVQLARSQGEEAKEARAAVRSRNAFEVSSNQRTQADLASGQTPRRR